MRSPVGFQKSFAHRGTPPPPVEEKLSVKPVAFYLPQFHPIEVNDRNWGKGFTEWNNVVRGAPEFSGHYQPRIPADLGFYDLRLPDIQVEQAACAASAGMAAFCYYYYWFDGVQPMLLPLENHLRNDRISLKFCLCFANENWTRAWDGRDQDVILAQSYGERFEERFWRDIVKFLSSDKYLRDSEDKPILLIYRPSIIPTFKAVSANLHRLALEAGFPGLHLIGNMALSLGAIGLDALYEFPPLANGTCAEHERGGSLPKIEVQGRLPASRATVYDYRQFVMRERMVRSTPEHVYPAVVPSWDNTARRPLRGSVVADSNPDLFSEWVELAARRAARTPERLLFVNAWNEWAEGAYLEPDQRFGWSYLDAFRRGLLAAEKEPANPDPICIFVHVFYPDVWDEIAKRLGTIEEPFNLVLTTPLDVALQPPATAQLQDFEILKYDNKGRDILPFLRALKDTRFRFDIGLKLHTKRSSHRIDGDEWRRLLLQSLLPEGASSSITQLLRADPNIGFIAPEGHWAPLADFMGSNREIILELMDACRMDGGDRDLETGRFIAGSMFWFRRTALESINDRELADLFSEEHGEIDGTAAHAMERLFALLGEKRGYVTATTDQISPLLAQTGSSYWTGTRLALLSDQVAPSTFTEKIALNSSSLRANIAFSPKTHRFLMRAIDRFAYSHRSVVELYRKLPVGLRIMVRRAMGRPVA